VIYQSIIQSINQSINQSFICSETHLVTMKKAHGWAEQWTAYCT